MMSENKTRGLGYKGSLCPVHTSYTLCYNHTLHFFLFMSNAENALLVVDNSKEKEDNLCEN